MIKPLSNNVLVEPEKAETKTASGIVIPDTVGKERPDQGKVVAVGEGKRNTDGKLIPMSVKKGDKVMFAKYGAEEIKVKGKEYFIISEDNILAIIG